MIYGNVGAPDRLDFTVMGPAVNRTARLESLTKSLGTSIPGKLGQIYLIFGFAGGWAAWVFVFQSDSSPSFDFFYKSVSARQAIAL